MKIIDRTISRRSVLAGGAAAILGYMVRPVFRSAKAQPQPAIVAAMVGEVPTEPGDSLWSQAQLTTITLNPQNLVLPRVFEAATASVDVRALYDGNRLGLLMEWGDSARDVDLGTVLQFRDGAANQFPEDPSFRNAAPDPGADSDSILEEFGYSTTQISAFHDAGVI